MRVSDIIDEVKEICGKGASSPLVYRTITRAVEILANKGLFDPLKRYVDIIIPEGTYTIALPREVKKPIRINLNNNPSFPRSQLFEFTMNTDGSDEGEEVGWSWSDRGIVCIQDETQLPSILKYVCTSPSDVGKTLKIKFRDENGIVRTETLVAALNDEDATGTTVAVAQVKRITRAETVAYCVLAGADAGVARYYPDETEPEYRAIKLSKTGVAARVIYRVKTPKRYSSEDDEIPLHSPYAVVLACKAVRLRQEEQWENAAKVLQDAVDLIKEEQESLDEPTTISGVMDAPTVANLNINTRDSVIVADVYDDASEIFGPVGREKLFDKITLAIEALTNKEQWDSTIGYCDLWAQGDCEAVNPKGRLGNGYFVLPGEIEAPLAINYDGNQMTPQNRWYEFSLGGQTGERNYSPCRHWTDVGETVLLNPLPLDPDTKQVIPCQVVAQPDSPTDDGTEVKLYGKEKLPDGTIVEIFRGGEPGWTVPCVFGSFSPGVNAPHIVHVDRITKETSSAFIKLIAFPEAPTNLVAIAALNDGSTTYDDLERLIKRRGTEDILLAGFATTGINTELLSVVGNESALFSGGSFDSVPVTGTYTLEEDFENLPAGWQAYVYQVSEDGPYFVIAGEDGNWGLFEGSFIDYNDLDEIGPLQSNTLLGTYTGSSGDQGLPPAAEITVSYAESQIAQLDVDCGKHFRKFIHPFVGSAELRPREEDATENHFWPAPGDTTDDWSDGLVGWLSYFEGAHAGERYYTKTFGSLQVFFLSSAEDEPDGNTIGSDQHAWLTEQVALSDAPWKIVVLCHPPYSSHASIDPGYTDLRWDFADLGIHAVIAGKRFSYERLETGGVVYFNVQMGISSEGNFSALLPESQDHHANGYLGLWIYATAQSVRFLVIHEDGTTVDSKELVSAVNNFNDPLLLGYWHPLETEPKYRLIKLPQCKSKRIRIRYRKRWKKIRSLFDQIPLRSKLAIITMMEALKAKRENPTLAAALEMQAHGYLTDEQRITNPIPGKMSIDPHMGPNVTGNMM